LYFALVEKTLALGKRHMPAPHSSQVYAMSGNGSLFVLEMTRKEEGNYDTSRVSFYAAGIS
jgi:hypothetical protein